MRRTAAVLLCLLAGGASAAAPSPEAGRALFTGERRFQAGGAPCGACHALGGEGLAATASLGPPLTSLAGMDPQALDGLLESLPFPSMAPVYEGRALTAGERADLAAWLLPAAARGAPAGGARVHLWGGALAVLLFLGLGAAASRRKPASRARLLAGAVHAKGGSR